MSDSSNGTRPPRVRLAYIADVPVEASFHGSALIYRLLQRYRTEHLVIVEQNIRRSLPVRRLPNVQYKELHLGGGRWLNTRLHRVAASWLTLSAKRQVCQIPAVLGDFRPQAVLTVAHGFSWLTAAAFAERNALPLHLIIHDDWPQMVVLTGLARQWMKRRYGEVYRQAASRLCVSPYMIEEYKRRYSVSGTLLYPSRSRDTPVFDKIENATASASRPFTIAFAGSLLVGEYVRQLVALSWLLPKIGGRLLMFGPFDSDFLAASGVNMKIVSLGGTLSSPELVCRLHAEADAVFVPESFEPGNSTKLSFPSKLTDYTAAAIPLLIWGSEESPAARWAATESGVAALVTDREESSMAKMLEKLAADLSWREQLSEASVEVGRRYFSPARAEAIFYTSLSLQQQTTKR